MLERAAPKLERIKNVQKLASKINNEILRAVRRAIPGYNNKLSSTFAVRDSEDLMAETDSDKTDGPLEKLNNWKVE